MSLGLSRDMKCRTVCAAARVATLAPARPGPGLTSGHRNSRPQLCPETMGRPQPHSHPGQARHTPILLLPPAPLPPAFLGGPAFQQLPPALQPHGAPGSVPLSSLHHQPNTLILFLQPCFTSKHFHMNSEDCGVAKGPHESNCKGGSSGQKPSETRPRSGRGGTEPKSMTLTLEFFLPPRTSQTMSQEVLGFHKSDSRGEERSNSRDSHPLCTSCSH